MRAQQLEYQFTPQSLEDAIKHSEQAIALDPGYADWRRSQNRVRDLEKETTEGLRLMSCALESECGSIR